MMTPITDTFQRPLRDLRISVTDRCNFRCVYCMPKEVFGTNYPFLKKEEQLTLEEWSRLVRVFASIGVQKVRITGGEPLLWSDLPSLISRIRHDTEIRDISLTTNGVFLPKMVKQLKNAGLNRVNISLDALDPNTFLKMNGGILNVHHVLDGIESAKDADLIVKVNMVVLKGVNEHEILPMASYFKDRGITLRFIEFMDVGNTNDWTEGKVMSTTDIFKTIHQSMPLKPLEASYFGEVAKRYQYVDSTAEVGFISSITNPFCTSCTRARISSDGQLYTCLFASKGVNMKEWLRSGISDEELSSRIKAVWEKRADQYSNERNRIDKKAKIEMSYIGG